jgi:Histidine kinase-, DNA gyrase B-, and HSP90-like ATPase
MVYQMKISRLTIEKLGVKLYDRVSAVLAELVANGYDADATEVTVTAPMGEYLAENVDGGVKDLGYEIRVADNGHGMTPEEMQAHYLVVGAERRARGELSRKLNRPVMGRKGIGKLAPFGICAEMEVISSGGKLVKRRGKQGYLTSHIIMRREKMMTPEESDYEPDIGDKDQTLQPDHGTTVILRKFAHRSVPEILTLARQLAHRFGVRSANWNIFLVDTKSLKTRYEVTPFDIPRMAGTIVRFVGPDGPADFTFPTKDPSAYIVEGPEGSDLGALNAWIQDDNGTYYPIRGWIAYAQESYRDDLEAGVRIMCRGKIATQTQIFNRSAGFHGELQIRSYLVGELHLDWLDYSEDLIETDRKDILWSDELGERLQDWGQSVLKLISKISRNPMKKKIWDLFVEKADLDRALIQAFPLQQDRELRENAKRALRILAQNVREDELSDGDYVQNVVQLGVLLGPLITVDEELRRAADEIDTQPLSAVATLLQRAKLAELSTFGTIARNRVKIIERLKHLLDAGRDLEDTFQKLLEEAPWLINPEWAPVTANQPLKTLRGAFEKWIKNETGEEINLSDFSDPLKKPDFVLTAQEGRIEIVEIKKPGYEFNEADFKRMHVYHEQMAKFLADPGHKWFKERFSSYHITLVCDSVSLSGVAKSAYDGMIASGVLTHYTWAVFLAKTSQVHQEFLEVATREREKVVNLEDHRQSEVAAPPAAAASE